MNIFYRLINSHALRFIISGGSAASVNLALLFILVHFMNMWYLAASIVAYVTSIIVSFTMQKFFTFKDYSKNNMSKQTFYYFLIQIINLGMNTFLMFLSVGLLHIHYMVSQKRVMKTL